MASQLAENLFASVANAGTKVCLMFTSASALFCSHIDAKGLSMGDLSRAHAGIQTTALVDAVNYLLSQCSYSKRFFMLPAVALPLIGQGPLGRSVGVE